jgi:hypothetical protein
MRSKHWVIVTVLLLANPAVTLAQAAPPPGTATVALGNSDVLLMVESGLKPREIIARIVTSNCVFDIFPPVLRDLRRRGVPDAVLEAMVLVPTGLPKSMTATVEPLPQTRAVKIPSGTKIDLETAYPVSSAVVKEGSQITFLVVEPVLVDGVVAIAPGAVAKARIIEAKKARSLGRAGALTWIMEYVVAIDGTRIPIQLLNRIKGGNRSGALAAGAALTTALVFPYTAPMAGVWAFKKGSDAVLPGSKRFTAKVISEAEIVGLRPETDRVFYHYAEALKKADAATATRTQFPRWSLRRGSYR